jgi:hypothetical protein
MRLNWELRRGWVRDTWIGEQRLLGGLERREVDDHENAASRRDDIERPPKRVVRLGETVCMAVGSYQVNGSAKSRTLAETWNGKRWARLPTPSPTSGANGSGLLGVSCSSTRRCLAVGNYANVSNDGSYAFAEMWNGQTWLLSTGANAAPGTTLLGAVSCPLTNACIAVGSGSTSTLAEQWSGGRWTTIATASPTGSEESSLTGVSCRSMNACVAVGGEYTNAGPGGFPLPLAEVWNGTAWTIVPTIVLSTAEADRDQLPQIDLRG